MKSFAASLLFIFLLYCRLCSALQADEPARVKPYPGLIATWIGQNPNEPVDLTNRSAAVGPDGFEDIQVELRGLIVNSPVEFIEIESENRACQTCKRKTRHDRWTGEVKNPSSAASIPPARSPAGPRDAGPSGPRRYWSSLSTLCCDWLASASADTAIDCRVDSAWLLAASSLLAASVRLDEMQQQPREEGGQTLLRRSSPVGAWPIHSERDQARSVGTRLPAPA